MPKSRQSSAWVRHLRTKQTEVRTRRATRSKAAPLSSIIFKVDGTRSVGVGEHAMSR
jgi:hypothetical protein